MGAEAAHSFDGNAAAHLHETVEAPPPGPWSSPAVSVERHVDHAVADARPQGGAIGRCCPGRRVGRPFTEEVGVREQAGQKRASYGSAGIKPGIVLAQRHFVRYAWLVPARRVNAEHVSAKASQGRGYIRDRQTRG